MTINFSTANSIWASVLAETLHRLGLSTAIICPGSRSAPLAIAFAQHPHIAAIPILDERSASFFALGLARRTGQPVALVCTSGTAGANFFPAVIEAHESRIPLLVLTADRPPEMRDCNAGQTVDQQKLYGSFPNWYSELAVPALDRSLLSYLRQTVIHAWERTLFPVPGVVHLNLPFRDPLAPLPQPEAQAWAEQFSTTEFFSALPAQRETYSSAAFSSPALPALPSGRGLLIAGVAQPHNPRAYCEAIAHLSQSLGLPVLAEGISPLRNSADLNPYLISTYDWLVQHPDWADPLRPDWVIRVGEMPTSKALRQWLERSQPQQWVIDNDDRNLDPLHLRTTHIRATVEQVAATVTLQTPPSRYVTQWCDLDKQVGRSLDAVMQNTDDLMEGKVAWVLSQQLPPQTPVFVANSTAVRDVEWFWRPGNREMRLLCNRGANGIDGTLSTALGMAHYAPSSVLLTGDLALLHDTNGLLLRRQFVGHLTIVLVNNNGGGIFERLPIAQFDPPFEDFFATPQSIDFAPLCNAYGVDYERITSWAQLEQRLNPLPTQGIRLLEVRCDRKADARWQQGLLTRLI